MHLQVLAASLFERMHIQLVKHITARFLLTGAACAKSVAAHKRTQQCKIGCTGSFVRVATHSSTAFVSLWELANLAAHASRTQPKPTKCKRVVTTHSQDRCPPNHWRNPGTASHHPGRCAPCCIHAALQPKSGTACPNFKANTGTHAVRIKLINIKPHL